MRDYGKVHTSFWSSSTMRDLSEDGRMLALYLMTSPHNTIAGVFRLPDGYASEDLQWTSQRVVKGFAELLAKGFANRCETTKWVWVLKHLEWNEPENPNQRKSARKIAMAIPDQCSWKPEFARVCGEIIAFEYEALMNPSGTVKKPFLNQEQEQEQKQKQEQDKKALVGQKPDDVTGKSESETVEKIFAYWQQTMNSPKSVLDKKRRDVIKRALQSYSPRDLCLAIKGCSLTPHNMGDNERATKFNGIHVCLRDADQIDRFIGACSAAPKSGTPQTKAEAVVAKNAGLGDALAASMGVAAGSPPNDGMTFEME